MLQKKGRQFAAMKINENGRPILDIKPTRFDRALEATGVAMLLVLWMFCFYSYSNTPDIVPIHFGTGGEPDGYGDARTVFLMPVIATVLFVFMSLAARKPENFNYTVTITPQNAQRKYKGMLSFMRWIKISVVMIILLIEFFSFNVAIGKTDRLPQWLLPAVFAMIFSPVIYFGLKGSNENS